MKCLICQNNSQPIFSSIILNKFKIIYFHCEKCGFLQTETPYWLSEAYSSPINLTDTGIVARNISLSRIACIIIGLFFDREGQFLDYAGGYGLFTRLMRDWGFDFYWDDKFCQNLLSRGFEFNKRDQKIEMITSFETFEHFDSPIVSLEEMLDISKNILFSTTLLPEIIPEPENWWYYGLEHGQHISFYQKKTLEYICQKYNLHLLSLGTDIHLFTEKKINLYWFKSVKYLKRLNYDQLIKKSLKPKTIDDSIMIKNQLSNRTAEMNSLINHP
jgi:hypothetical protein